MNGYRCGFSVQVTGTALERIGQTGLLDTPSVGIQAGPGTGNLILPSVVLKYDTALKIGDGSSSRRIAMPSSQP